LDFLRPFFAETALPVELAIAGKPAAPGRRIRNLGFVNDIESVYQAADAVVLASRYEAFGLAAVESALCGTPALVSSRAGCGEAVREPALSTFRPERPEELAAAIVRIVDLDREGLGDLARCLNYDPGREAFMDEFAGLAGLSLGARRAG
jgi:glycosyltransferase involved in cell wall biosynthesis